MIEVIEAEKAIEKFAYESEVEYVAILHAKGRVLAEDILADRSGPPFDRVAMDGIGLAFDSLSICDKFHCEGMQAAGMAELCLDSPLSGCLEVMTGAVLPKKCDTVIPFEKIKQEGRVYLIDDPSSVIKGQNIHNYATDYKKGSVLLKKGLLISTPVIAVLASEGYERVPVKRNPKIAILTTGSELVGITEKPLAHQIRMSNVYAAHACLEGFGVTEKDRYHLSDDKEETYQKIKKMLDDYDVLILSGGVSKGKKDYVPEVLTELGVEKIFHKIKQKPGKPMFFGVKGNKLIFALPGNPVSMLVCMVRYVLPWLKLNQNTNDSFKKIVCLKDSIKPKEKLTLFVPVKLSIDEDERRVVEKIRVNGSGDFNSLTGSTGFIEVPAGVNEIPKGNLFSYFSWE